MSTTGARNASAEPSLSDKRERGRGRAATLRRAPSDSDCSGETASLSADSDRHRPMPPALPKRTRSSRRRGSEWEVLEGLKDGQRFERRPEVYNGYLHKKRKWPLKGWHKRFFVIDGGILVYARSPTDVSRGRLHGSVDVGLSVISAKQRRRRIDIDADEFIYHLRAKTPEVYRTWLAVLKVHRLYRQHLLTFGAREHVTKSNQQLEDVHTLEEPSSRESYSPTATSSLSITTEESLRSNRTYSVYEIKSQQAILNCTLSANSFGKKSQVFNSLIEIGGCINRFGVCNDKDNNLEEVFKSKYICDGNFGDGSFVTDCENDCKNDCFGFKSELRKTRIVPAYFCLCKRKKFKCNVQLPRSKKCTNIIKYKKKTEPALAYRDKNIVLLKGSIADHSMDKSNQINLDNKVNKILKIAEKPSLNSTASFTKELRLDVINYESINKMSNMKAHVLINIQNMERDDPKLNEFEMVKEKMMDLNSDGKLEKVSKREISAIKLAKENNEKEISNPAKVTNIGASDSKTSEKLAKNNTKIEATNDIPIIELTSKRTYSSVNAINSRNVNFHDNAIKTQPSQSSVINRAPRNTPVKKDSTCTYDEFVEALIKYIKVSISKNRIERDHIGSFIRKTLKEIVEVNESKDKLKAKYPSNERLLTKIIDRYKTNQSNKYGKFFNYLPNNQEHSTKYVEVNKNEAYDHATEEDKKCLLKPMGGTIKIPSLFMKKDKMATLDTESWNIYEEKEIKFHNMLDCKVKLSDESKTDSKKTLKGSRNMAKGSHASYKRTSRPYHNFNILYSSVNNTSCINKSIWRTGNDKIELDISDYNTAKVFVKEEPNSEDITITFKLNKKKDSKISSKKPSKICDLNHKDDNLLFTCNAHCLKTPIYNNNNQKDSTKHKINRSKSVMTVNENTTSNKHLQKRSVKMKTTETIKKHDVFLSLNGPSYDISPLYSAATKPRCNIHNQDVVTLFTKAAKVDVSLKPEKEFDKTKLRPKDTGEFCSTDSNVTANIVTPVSDRSKDLKKINKVNVSKVDNSKAGVSYATYHNNILAQNAYLIDVSKLSQISSSDNLVEHDSHVTSNNRFEDTEILDISLFEHNNKSRTSVIESRKVTAEPDDFNDSFFTGKEHLPKILKDASVNTTGHIKLFKRKKLKNCVNCESMTTDCSYTNHPIFKENITCCRASVVNSKVNNLLKVLGNNLVAERYTLRDSRVLHPYIYPFDDSFLNDGLMSPGSPTLRGPQAGFVSGTPGGRLASWIVESGGTLENASRELGQAQLSVQQLQQLLDALELQQQQHHDTDVSTVLTVEAGGTLENASRELGQAQLSVQQLQQLLDALELQQQQHHDTDVSTVLTVEAGGTLENASRELGQAQLSVQQLQQLLDALELQQQQHHDTDVSTVLTVEAGGTLENASRELGQAQLSVQQLQQLLDALELQQQQHHDTDVSTVLTVEAGGTLENASRELGQAQLSVQQLQQLLDALELQQQQHHDTDVSLEGASPSVVKKDRRKFGLRKKKSNSKCASVELAPLHLDASNSHMALTALTAPPSPGAVMPSSVPNSAASLPMACPAVRPQSLPGAESLTGAIGVPLSTFTPDHQLREDFAVLAKDLVTSLKSVVSTLVNERSKLRSAMEDADKETPTKSPAFVAALRSNLNTALQQNSELRSRLSRIHDASDIAEVASMGNNHNDSAGATTGVGGGGMGRGSLSLSSSGVSAAEFYDAEEHNDTKSDHRDRHDDHHDDHGDENETGVIELDGDSTSEAGSLTSEEGSASSDNSEIALRTTPPAGWDSHTAPGSTNSTPGTVVPWSRRARLPAPRASPAGPSLWNLLYKNIGKDLSQVSMPVSINEPLNILQRLCEELEYSELLDSAAGCTDPVERMCLVSAFAVSCYASSAHPQRAACKPFNPLLGETFECVREDRAFRFIAEQVSHHPPISACHAESPRWILWQEARIKTKFWGKSMEFQPCGKVHVKLLTTGDHYSWNKVTTCVHNLFGGQRWVDQYGDMHVTCHGTDIACKLNFIKASSWSTSKHEVRGSVAGALKRVRLSGRWSEALHAGEPPAHRLLWRPGAMPAEHELYYGFTRFALELNEMEPGMRDTLPSTDTRLRPDQRALEEGDIDKAEVLKHQLEQAQRERRRDNCEPTPSWFHKSYSDGEEMWVFNNEYWKAREAGFPGHNTRLW